MQALLTCIKPLSELQDGVSVRQWRDASQLDYAVDRAVACGHLALLKDGHIKPTPWNTTHEALFAACRAGSIDALRWLLDHKHDWVRRKIRYPPLDELYAATAQSGNEQFLHYLEKHIGEVYQCGFAVHDAAVSSVDVSHAAVFHESEPDFFSWFANQFHSPQQKRQFVLKLAEVNATRQFKWYCVRFRAARHIDVQVCKWFGRHGNLAMLEWIRCNYNFDWRLPDLLVEACSHGHIHLAQVILEHVEERESDQKLTFAARAAAANGQVEVLRWLKQEYGVNVKVFVPLRCYAASITTQQLVAMHEQGLIAQQSDIPPQATHDLEMLNWLLDHGFSIQMSVALYACYQIVQQRDFATFDRLCKLGAEQGWTKHLLEAAIGVGIETCNLEALAQLQTYDQFKEGMALCIKQAGFEGNLVEGANCPRGKELMEWCRARFDEIGQCFLTHAALAAAAALIFNAPVLEWIHRHRPQILNSATVLAIIERAPIATLKHLNKLNIPFPPTHQARILEAAVRAGEHEKVVFFVDTLDWTCNTMLCSLAIQHDRLDTLRWLLAHPKHKPSSPADVGKVAAQGWAHGLRAEDPYSKRIWSSDRSLVWFLARYHVHPIPDIDFSVEMPLYHGRPVTSRRMLLRQTRSCIQCSIL